MITSAHEEMASTGQSTVRGQGSIWLLVFQIFHPKSDLNVKVFTLFWSPKAYKARSMPAHFRRHKFGHWQGARTPPPSFTSCETSSRSQKFVETQASSLWSGVINAFLTKLWWGKAINRELAWMCQITNKWNSLLWRKRKEIWFCSMYENSKEEPLRETWLTHRSPENCVW